MYAALLSFNKTDLTRRYDMHFLIYIYLNSRWLPLFTCSDMYIRILRQASVSQLEEEVASLRAERDQLNQGYRKAVRQKQSLVQHIKDLQSEDSELHALMQSLLQSAHQAVAERDTLERLVKPAAGSGLTSHADTLSAQDHRQVPAGGGQMLQSVQQQPLGQGNHSINADSQAGEWVNNQSFLSC